MSIKAIVFDFDGVLADSEMLHFRVYNELLASSGIQLTKEEYCDEYLGFDDRDAATDFLQRSTRHRRPFATAHSTSRRRNESGRPAPFCLARGVVPFPR